MAFLILVIAPGMIVFNMTPGFSYILYLTHPFMIVCVTLYFIKAVYSLLFYHVGVSTRVRECLACPGFLIFRGRKRKISRDFQGQIRGKIGRFRAIFEGEKSKFTEKSAHFAGF